MKPERRTYADSRIAGGYNSVECDDFASVTKLGPLEDIEQRWGIDLLTLANALENGIWFINEHGTMSGPHMPLVGKDGLILSLDYEFQYTLKFGDYGKKMPMGWSLAKEWLK